jgi:transcription elongation factor GreA
MDKFPITIAGHAALEAEFMRLQQVERPRIIEAIAEARSHGDLSENAEYHSAKEAQSHNEGRIAELEDKLQRAEVIDVSKLSGKFVKFGAKVRIADEDSGEEQTYQIVGAAESDINHGLLSVTAPLARALIGKTIGDTVEVTTPRGSKAYEIVDVAFG